MAKSKKKPVLMCLVLNRSDEEFVEELDGVSYIIPAGEERAWPLNIAKFFCGDWQNPNEKERKREMRDILARFPSDQRKKPFPLVPGKIFDPNELKPKRKKKTRAEIEEEAEGEKEFEELEDEPEPVEAEAEVQADASEDADEDRSVPLDAPRKKEKKRG